MMFTVPFFKFWSFWNIQILDYLLYLCLNSKDFQHFFYVRKDVGIKLPNIYLLLIEVIFLLKPQDGL